MITRGTTVHFGEQTVARRRNKMAPLSPLEMNVSSHVLPSFFFFSWHAVLPGPRYTHPGQIRTETAFFIPFICTLRPSTAVRGKALRTNPQQSKASSSRTNPQTSDVSDDDDPHFVETPSGTSRVLVQGNNPIPNQPQPRF